MVRRSYAGGAAATSLAVAMAAGDPQLTVASGTGWPTGGFGPFFVVIDPGLASEEKVLCSSRTNEVLYITTRGADGTTAQGHSIGAVVQHVWTATDADEANAHVNATANVHGVTNDLGTYITGRVIASTNAPASDGASVLWLDSDGTP